MITGKHGQDQSDTTKQVGQSQNEIMEKLAEDGETIVVFEEQEEKTSSHGNQLPKSVTETSPGSRHSTVDAKHPG